MEKSEQVAIGRIIERVAAREGLELVHWELIGPRNHSILRIFIDKPGGVSHADCETVSHQVSTLLDVDDVIDHGYVLEVSSPGIERGLYKPADFERFAGSRIRLRATEPINGQRNFKGKLLGLEDGVVKLDADGIGPIEIGYELVAKANVEYEY